MCVILYNTCETGHIESSVLLSLSASCSICDRLDFKRNIADEISVGETLTDIRVTNFIVYAYILSPTSFLKNEKHKLVTVVEPLSFCS